MIKEWIDGIGHLLDIVIEKQRKKQQDYLFLVSGVEGSGKSFSTLKCIEHIEVATNTITPIEHVAGSLEEFALAVHGKPDNQVFVLDEGKELENANWQSKEVKAFKKWITKNRIRSHIYFIAFPNPLSMLPYVRNDKLIAVLLMIKPGVCYVYSGKTFAPIVDDLKQKRIRDILMRSPNFICRVPEYKGHLLKDYKAKKRSWTRESDDRFLEDLGVNKVLHKDDLPKENVKLISTGKVAKKFGVNDLTIRNRVKEGMLKPYKITSKGRMMFNEAEIDKMDTI